MLQVAGGGYKGRGTRGTRPNEKSGLQVSSLK